MVGGMAAGAHPPLCSAVVLRHTSDRHSAGVSGATVSRNRADIEVRDIADRGDFPPVPQRNKGSASDLEAQLASGSSQAEALSPCTNMANMQSLHMLPGIVACYTDEILARMVGAHYLHHSCCIGAHRSRGRSYEDAWLSQFFLLPISSQGSTCCCGAYTPRHELEAAQGIRSVTHEVRGRPLREWLGWIWDSKHCARVVWKTPEMPQCWGQRSCFVKLSWQQRDCRMCKWYQCLSLLSEASDQYNGSHCRRV